MSATAQRRRIGTVSKLFPGQEVGFWDTECSSPCILQCGQHFQGLHMHQPGAEPLIEGQSARSWSEWKVSGWGQPTLKAYSVTGSNKHHPRQPSWQMCTEGSHISSLSWQLRVPKGGFPALVRFCRVRVKGRPVTFLFLCRDFASHRNWKHSQTLNTPSLTSTYWWELPLLVPLIQNALISVVLLIFHNLITQ